MEAKVRTEISEDLYRMFLLAENIVLDGYDDLTAKELKKIVKIKESILDVMVQVRG